MSEVRQFAYRLALALGIWDAEGLLHEMGSQQLEYWRAFAAMEPFGYEQEWQRAGTIAAAMFNSNPFRGEDAKWVEPKDLIPRRVRIRPKNNNDFCIKSIAKRAGGKPVIDKR